MARSLELLIYEEEGLYYPCSENKGTDQLCSYCTADLRLCFRIGKNAISHDVAHKTNEFVGSIDKIYPKGQYFLSFPQRDVAFFSLEQFFTRIRI